MSSPNEGAVSAAPQAETVAVSASPNWQESNLKQQAVALLTESYAETATYQVGTHHLASSRRFLMEEAQKGVPTWCALEAGELTLWLEARKAKLHSLYGSALENFSQALQRMAAAAGSATGKKDDDDSSLSMMMGIQLNTLIDFHVLTEEQLNGILSQINQA